MLAVLAWIGPLTSEEKIFVNVDDGAYDAIL